MSIQKNYLLLLFLLLQGCSGEINTSTEKSYQPQTNRTQTNRPQTPELPNKIQEQLNAVRRGKYQKQSLLNYSERKVYNKLLKMAIEHKDKVKLFPQVSLGELLSCNEEEYKGGYNQIKCKRVDFCFVEKTSFKPLMVVEYHGSGHYQSNYKIRDEVKKTACQSAGVEYIAITEKNKANQFQKISDFLELLN